MVHPVDIREIKVAC